MNKKEIITVVANKLTSQVDKKEVQSVIDTLLETIKESLQNNERVNFKGFLSFETKLIQEKSGHSFGKDRSIASRYVPKVKFSKSFKDILALNTKG